MSDKEGIKRLVEITDQADEDSISPTERVRRAIYSAIESGNPLINPEDTFIVVGIEGHDRAMFPCGSFNDVEEARKLARSKTVEEPLYSDGEEILTTFHVFTKDGFHVPWKERESSKEEDLK